MYEKQGDLSNDQRLMCLDKYIEISYKQSSVVLHAIFLQVWRFML